MDIYDGASYYLIGHLCMARGSDLLHYLAFTYPRTSSGILGPGVLPFLIVYAWPHGVPRMRAIIHSHHARACRDVAAATLTGTVTVNPPHLQSKKGIQASSC